MSGEDGPTAWVLLLWWLRRREYPLPDAGLRAVAALGEIRPWRR
ncbi:hypothetical protein LCL61_37725 [Amycolatopsis coloradensis]|uniref:Uncharacterized protein n=1 Tax=Amycolatopsis coloradensis TaxID=76021 RepID=A0ACD5BPP9_9PSEU